MQTLDRVVRVLDAVARGDGGCSLADLVRDTCLVGTAEELIERIKELERGGLRELMWATGTDDKWRFSRELADRVMARV